MEVNYIATLYDRLMYKRKNYQVKLPKNNLNYYIQDALSEYKFIVDKVSTTN